MASVQNILKELAATVGYEAVRSACINFAAKKPADLGPSAASVPTGKGKGKKAAAPASSGEAKPKREQSETQKAWVSFIDEVLAEMKAAAGDGTAAGVKVTRKMAMAEAGRRKRETDPEAKAAYEKRQAIKDAKKRSREGAAASLAAPEAEPEPETAAPAVPSAYSEEEQRVFQYLFDLQASGRTNMMGAPRFLVNELGLNRADADDYTSRYMAEYKKLAKTFGSAAE
jgi:hypothetical protein